MMEYSSGEEVEKTITLSSNIDTSLIFSLTSPSSLFQGNTTDEGLSINGSYFANYTNFSDSNSSISDFDIDDDSELPRELREMSESSKHCMIAYCILFGIATSGNLTVLLSVFKQYRKTKSRISLLIIHLSIADLIVCCTLIPTEVAWRWTIQWRGGNILCKMMQFLRAFGLYLSSMVLIAVSFDRFFAILFPMKMLKRQGHQKVKLMLWIAWIASALFSAPQAILFSLASHPEFPSFKQCVTNEFLKNTEDVRLYSIFSVSAMYFAPLFVILFTYTAILIKIIRKAHQNHQPITSDERPHLDLEPTHRDRRSTRFRMSLRNLSSASRNYETTGSTRSSVNTMTTACSNIQPLQNPFSHHNHSKALSMGSQGGSSRRTKAHHISSVQDQGELSSEEGSYSESTCSTMNNVVSCPNNSTIFGSGASAHTSTGSLRYSSQFRQQAAPQSPDVVTLGRANSHRTTLVLRRSDNAASTMSRAKNRTLVMTIVIVVVFITCWTPYCVMTLWYMFDWEGAKEVDSRVQDGLFVMAVANSCVNPLIYGSFAKNCCGLSKVLGRLRPSQPRGQ